MVFAAPLVQVFLIQDHPGDPSSFSYTVGGLRPWTQYQFGVRAHNHAGHTLSPWVTVTTKQAPPSGLAAPSVTHLVERPNELLVSWAAPLEPNGVLLSYRVQRDGVGFPFSFDPSVTRHHDEDLAPFTAYRYVVTSSCFTPSADTSLWIQAVPSNT